MRVQGVSKLAIYTPVLVGAHAHILWLLHDKQKSVAEYGKLQRSPEHRGECCLANPVPFRAHPALQLLHGKELGRGHPGLLLFLQEKQEKPEDKRPKDKN